MAKQYKRTRKWPSAALNYVCIDEMINLYTNDEKLIVSRVCIDKLFEKRILFIKNYSTF